MAADVEKVVNGKLVAALTAAGLTAVTVHPNIAPADAEMPYVVYALGGQQRYPHGGLVNATSEVNVFAEEYDQMTTVVEAIRRVDRSGNEIVNGVNLRSMDVENITDNFEPPVDGGEMGVRSINVTLRVFIIESNYNGD